MKPYPVFWWYGGKHYLLKDLLTILPPHRYYAELFGGAATLLLHKPPVAVETYNDLHDELVNFFRVLRNPLMKSKLIESLTLTPYSESEFRSCLEPANPTDYPTTTDFLVERARRWFVRCAQSFNGNTTAWSHPSPRNPRNRAKHFQVLVENLHKHAERFKHVMIRQRNALEILPEYNEKGWLIYLDPPYHPDTRTSKDAYTHELSRAEHQELIRILLGFDKAMVILSGYDHPDYAPLEQVGWHKRAITIQKHSSGKKQNFTQEIIWTNFKPQGEGSLF